MAYKSGVCTSPYACPRPGLFSVSIRLCRHARCFSANIDSGADKHVTGKKIGLHAVKVIGWGVDPAGVHFWSAPPSAPLGCYVGCLQNANTVSFDSPCKGVQNSWNASWGMEGSFKIAEGECGFEEQVHAGKPCVGRDATFCVGGG